MFPTSTRRESWLSLPRDKAPSRVAPRVLKARGLPKSGAPRVVRPGPTRHLWKGKSPAHLGPQRQPSRWHQQLGTTGPLGGDSCQAIKNEVFREKGRELHFPAAFHSAAPPPHAASASWRGATQHTGPGLRVPEPRCCATPDSGRRNGMFSFQSARRAGPTGFPRLARATTQRSGKETVRLHPKWLLHWKPNPSRSLPRGQGLHTPHPPGTGAAGRVSGWGHIWQHRPAQPIVTRWWSPGTACGERTRGPNRQPTRRRPGLKEEEDGGRSL